MPYLEVAGTSESKLVPLLWSWSTTKANFDKPIVVLDRDNTLIRDAGRSNKVADLEFLTDAIDALILLTTLGYEIAIATNQAAIGRNLCTMDQLALFHEKMDQTIFDATGIHLSVIAICPHVPEDLCACRKPRPGLLNAIATHSLHNPVLFIGDMKSDLEAAQEFGIQGRLISNLNLLDSVRGWVKLNDSR